MYFVANCECVEFESSRINSTMDFHNRQVVWFHVYIHIRLGKIFEMETLIKSLPFPSFIRKPVLQDIEKLNHI